MSDAAVRSSPEELWHDLREVSQKIRHDWDITRPELRENWEHGDKKQHWPYGAAHPFLAAVWQAASW